MKTINSVPITNIETKEEQMWFSIIKNLLKGVEFGNIEINFNIRNKKVTNISEVKVKKNFNIGA